MPTTSGPSLNPTDTCPACRGRSEFRFSVSIAEAAQHFVLCEEYPERHDALMLHIKDLWGQDTCEIRQCADCGFGFASPFVAGDATFYNLAYPRVNYPPTKWEYKATAKLLAERVRPPNGDVLDVGAGFGFFLDMIKPHLAKDQKCFAIEYNDQAVSILEKRGYCVVRDDLRSSQFDSFARKFAHIFLFQVVEHMDGLNGLFGRIHHLLADNGSVFIAVPNSIRTDFQERSGSLIDMPPNHIGRWTEKAFSVLAERTGLQIVSAVTEPFHILNFAMVDLKFYHLKRSQSPGTLANRIRSLRASEARKVMEAALALSWAPIRLPVLLKAARSSEPLGNSMLVELARKS